MPERMPILPLPFDPDLPKEDARQRFIRCVREGGSLLRILKPCPGPTRIIGHGDIIKRIVNGYYVWQAAEEYVARLPPPA